MKYLVFILVLFMAFGVYGQTKTIPNYLASDEPRIEYRFLVGDGGDGVDTTSAFRIDNLDGALNLFWLTDTTGYDTPDSCMTINIQLRTKDGVWSDYGFRGSDTYTKLDTVDRAIVNTAATVGFYTPLALYDQFQPGYEARLILQIGVGDSLLVTEIRKVGF